ncbi:MAG: hypothetical protein Q7R35_11025 [Elusimicrobiota bacterium]|nr:hypothetical protein [Elusimicrobiota bacterium]
MGSTKSLVSVSAVLLSFALLPVKASAYNNDGGFADSLSQSVSSLNEQSKSQRTPTVSTGSSISNELSHFWEDLKKDTFDDICKNAELELNKEGKLANIAGLGAEFKRYMKKFPNEKIALIDEVKVSLSAALGNDTLHLPDMGGLGVSLTGLLEGKSQVVRPLEGDRYCRELDTLVKLYQVKTVLPLKASRIVEMKKGEIWKLPLILRMGFGASIGTTINEVLNISLSAGKSKESRPSVTLYRMDDNNLRLRLRIDRVEVRSVGVSASTLEIPMADIGLWNAENALANLINKTWAKEINKYIALKLSFGHSRFTGKKLLLEFVLNPNNPEQMAGLEKFLIGDFGIVKRFIEMGLRFNNFSEDDESLSGLGEIEGVASQAGQAVDSESSYAGSNIYHGQSNGLHLQLPIAHTRDNSWSSSYNRYQSLDREGQALHVQQHSRVTSGSSMNIPFVGTTMKYDSQRNIYVVNKEDIAGAVTRPVLMYQQYEGFVKQGDGTARYMLEKANSVLRYVGMNGDGTDAGNVLPSAEIFPPLPFDPDAEPDAPQPAKFYKSAVMGFKLLISDRGVEDIIFAPAQAIMKAYMNVMREVESVIIEKVMDLFTINKEGKVVYDSKEVSKRFGASFSSGPENGTNPLDIVRTLAYTATQIISDIASVKDAPTWKEQSTRLSKVAAGGSRSNLKYEDFLKVVVQLVKPGDVSAEVYVHTDKRVKGEADVTQTYQFFNTRDNSFDNTIAEVTQARERFAEPSLLTD